MSFGPHELSKHKELLNKHAIVQSAQSRGDMRAKIP